MTLRISNSFLYSRNAIWFLLNERSKLSVIDKIVKVFLFSFLLSNVKRILWGAQCTQTQINTDLFQVRKWTRHCLNYRNQIDCKADLGRRNLLLIKANTCMSLYSVNKGSETLSNTITSKNNRDL